MRFIGDIAEDAEVRAIASGAITDGASVIVNADGTVSIVSSSPDSLGDQSSAVYSGDYQMSDNVYDTGQDKVLFIYNGASQYGYAVVGTVSGTSVSFGTPTAFISSTTAYLTATYDPDQGKTAIFWNDQGNSNQQKAVVATISGTSVSFGSIVTFSTTNGGTPGKDSTYDTSENKILVAYTDTNTSAKVVAATISGTDISFGTAVEFLSTDSSEITIQYDTNVNKSLVAYRNSNNSNKVDSKVVSLSGTSVTLGSETSLYNAIGDKLASTYDSTNNKIVVAYRHDSGTTHMKFVVATISGTSVSYGTPADTGVNFAQSPCTANFSYNVSANKVIFAGRDDGNSYVQKYVSGRVSGTSISMDTPVTYYSTANDSYQANSVYDPDQEKTILFYADGTAGAFKNPVTRVLTLGAGDNITSENYIGIANAAYADGQKATVKTTGSIARNVPAQLAAGSAGTPVVPDEEGAFISATFDSNSNRVVVAYQDGDNSNYGTAVVGTVTASDNSISHGTPVVFNSANTYYTESTFDSNSNKVVITYRNIGDSNRGTAIVGTVDPSDNSISFGTAVVYEAGETSNSSSAFDSSNNKVVIAYEDEDDSQKGKAIVGTVSGTAISFGTAAVFNNANTGFTSTAFDTTNNKVVIAFADKGNSNRGTAIVGTVSGTDISFGSEAIFNSGTSAEIHHSISFNPVAGKMLIAYVDTDDSEKGKAIVGTVSGTSISFGTASVYNTRPEQSETVYDSERDLIVIVYGDNNNSRRGTAIGATISGTSVSFSAELAFHSSSGNKNGVRVTYDSNANKAVAAYTDAGNSNVLTTTVFATAGNGPLVIGQQYFVQTDGSLGTSADSPSVIAGTAIGASDLIVKG